MRMETVTHPSGIRMPDTSSTGYLGQPVMHRSDRLLHVHRIKSTFVIIRIPHLPWALVRDISTFPKISCYTAKLPKRILLLIISAYRAWYWHRWRRVARYTARSTAGRWWWRRCLDELFRGEHTRSSVPRDGRRTCFGVDDVGSLSLPQASVCFSSGIEV